MRRLAVVTLLCLFNLLNCAEWSYNNQDDWPGSCQNGHAQSPIAIYSEESISLRRVPNLRFSNAYFYQYSANITNDGHSVKVTFGNRADLPTVSGGGLRHTYILDSFHFHWAAEHTINGHRAPLEGHFVHYAKKYGSLQNAVNFPDGVLVLAVFYELFDFDNEVFSNLIDSVDEISHHVNEPVKLEDAVNVFEFLPFDTSEYYRYQGSLTTPNCNESVTWIIFAQPSYIEESQLELFEKVFDDHNHLIEFNYRQAQPINNRVLFYVCK